MLYLIWAIDNAGELILSEEILKRTSDSNLVVEEGGNLEAVPLKGNLSDGKRKEASSSKDSTEESFWVPDSGDEDEMCPSKDADGDGLHVGEERPPDEEESSCVERGKKRKRIAKAVSAVKRKKVHKNCRVDLTPVCLQ